MSLLVQKVQYGSINTIDTATMGYYVIKFISEPYTLQEEKMHYEQISTTGELVVKAQYMNCIQDNTKWYWEQKHNRKIYFPHTQNCISMLGCHYGHRSKKYQNCLQ